MPLMSYQIGWAFKHLSTQSALVALMRSADVVFKRSFIFAAERATVAEEFYAPPTMNSL